jgi:hypothetical protein
LWCLFELRNPLWVVYECCDSDDNFPRKKYFMAIPVDILESEETRPSIKHYVNNKKLLLALTEYRKLVLAAKARGHKKPPVPEYVAECIILIAENLSRRPNFFHYPYREDMVGDAIENCVMYISAFNHEKSNNAFSYITQICCRAFIRRIKKEKRQSYTKLALAREMDKDGSFTSWLRDMSGDSEITMASFFKLTPTDLENFDKPAKKKAVVEVDLSLEIEEDSEL